MSDQPSEIIPDLKDLPDWAVDAFHDGQLFNETFKRIESFEADLEACRAVSVAMQRDRQALAAELKQARQDKELVGLAVKFLTTAKKYGYETSNDMVDENIALKATLAAVRGAIQKWLDGDYPCPRSYRPNDCPHGMGYYRECGECEDAYWTKTLVELDKALEQS